mgnify:FL=1
MPIMMFVLGYMAIQLNVKSPYCLWQYMVVTLIMYMGYWFNRYVKADEWSIWMNIAVAAVGLSCIVIATNYGFIAQLQPASVNKESAMALVVVPAFAGVSIHSLSALIKKTSLERILAYIGEHSFSIMALHFLAFKVVNLLQVKMYGYSITRLADFPVIEYEGLFIWFLAYVFIGVTLPLILSNFFHLLMSKAERFRT